MARRRDWGAGDFGKTSTVGGHERGQTGTPVWKVCENEVPRGRTNHVNEALFTVGNGYIGVRGCFEEGYDGPADRSGMPTEQGIYLNGFYEEHIIKYPEVGYGQAERDSVMLNVVNSKLIKLTVDDEPFSMYKPHNTVHDYHRELDLKTGVLSRDVDASVHNKRVHVQTRRLACLGDGPFRKHTWAIEYKVTVNADDITEITLSSELDGKVTNKPQSKDPRVGSGLQGQVLKMWERSAESEDWCHIRSYTEGSHLELVTAMSNVCVDHTGKEVKGVVEVDDEMGVKVTYSVMRPMRGATYTLTKYVAYCSTQGPKHWDMRTPSPMIEDKARKVLTSAREAKFEGLVGENTAFLDSFFRVADIEIEGDRHLQQGLRFNSFHLVQAVGRDAVTNVGAKGLSGEGYCGHYFWDTEIYIMPFFLYNAPHLARNLCMFRIQTLDKARKRARDLGGVKKGALYPWRTIHGDECSSYFPAGTAQMHINSDIAWACKQYVEATNDVELLKEGGAEMLLEMARFWLCYGSWSEGKTQFQICCVTGPDEYTCLVNNNYYTNVMVQDALRYAHDVAYLLKHEHPEFYKELVKKIDLDEDELAEMLHAAEKMHLPYEKRLGVHPQDDSFLRKEDWDFENTPADKYPLLLHYHYLVIYKYKVIKQADLVLALLLQGDKFTDKEKKMNFDYYEPLTTHDSSLSTAVYAVMASEIGYYQKAYNYFRATARMDLDNIHHNTQHGIHTACMAGTWMCVVRGFAGLRVYNNVVHLNPYLPDEWNSYKFRLCFHGSVLECHVKARTVVYRCIEGKVNFVHAGSNRVHLRTGQSFELLLRGKFEDLHALSFDTVVIDLDVVLPGIQAAHFVAWKDVICDLLTSKGEKCGTLTVSDYISYLQNQIGNHRYSGLDQYLRKHGIKLPFGESHDLAGFDSLWAVGKKKKDLLDKRQEEEPLHANPEMLRFLKALKREGIKVGFVSYSKSGHDLVKGSGALGYCDAFVTGKEMGQLGLRGKPHMDMYERVVEQLYTAASRAVLFINDPVGFDPGALGRFRYCYGYPVSYMDPTLRTAGFDVKSIEDRLKGAGMDMVVETVAPLDADAIDDHITGGDGGESEAMDARIARLKAMRETPASPRGGGDSASVTPASPTH
eukprot:Hpha_TRINITY_DN8557_c0_g2::TRINITY_DN8557_c0_g2_i1::g.146479::m.146479/K05342/E2.4.1.64; alpha,alpha-trehalose phosphorylase